MGGIFKTINNIQLNHVAQWNGTNWTALGGGLGYDPEVWDIDFTDNGSVIVAGNFLVAGGSTENMNNIALWNGTKWSGLNGGVNGLIINKCGDKLAFIRDIAVTKDVVYASGRFTQMGSNGTLVNNIAMFNLTEHKWYVLGNDTSFQSALLYTNALSERGGIIVIGRYEVVYEYTDFVLDNILFAEWSPGNTSWFYLLQDPMTTFLDAGEIHAIAKNGSDLYVGLKKKNYTTLN